MKNKVDEVKRALKGNSLPKKILTQADEDYIHLIAKTAKRKLTDYEGNLQSKRNKYASKASEGLMASRNGLRKFYNNNAQKLNSILMKCGVAEVSDFVLFFLNKQLFVWVDLNFIVCAVTTV